jgi:PAS domain S-box-containing protein
MPNVCAGLGLIVQAAREQVMTGGTRETVGGALYQIVFENSAIGLSVTDIDGRIHPNQAFAAMLGYQRDEMDGKNWRDFTHPEDIQAGSELLAELVRGSVPYARLVKRYLHKTGRTVWGEVTTVLQLDRDGKPAFTITSVLDVSQRKQLEDALLLRGAMLVAEHEALPEGILVVDAQGQVASFNRRFLEVCGIPQDSVAAGHDGLLAEAAKRMVDPAEFLAKVAALSRSPLAVGQDRLRSTDGRLIERWSTPMLAPSGANLGRLWCFRDVTESGKGEQVLRDRLEELERWQDLMLDREERIGALKREVNELCRRLGEDARYGSQVPTAMQLSCGPFRVTAELPRLEEPGSSDGDET